LDNPERLFRALAGRWQLLRKVDPGGRLSGHATFTEEGEDTYHYREEGELTLDRHDDGLEATRDYIFHLEHATIAVYFGDGPDKGKLFHHLDFHGLTRAEADHQCGQDHYHSLYEFDFPEEFRITHTVKGPRKDYVSRSVYRREESGESDAKKD
jgi:hypothetical protein